MKLREKTHDEMIREEARLLRNMVGRHKRRARVLRLSRLRSRQKGPTPTSV